MACAYIGHQPGSPRFSLAQGLARAEHVLDGQAAMLGLGSAEAADSPKLPGLLCSSRWAGQARLVEEYVKPMEGRRRSSRLLW